MIANSLKQPSQRILSTLINAIQVGAFLILCFLIMRSRPYPFADDWHLVTPLRMSQPHEFLSWLFAQQVDHRIPMQKLAHYILAQISGYDMRALMLFNAALGLLTSICLVRAARLQRKRHSLGDALIPLVILTPAAGYSLWAVHLQFLSSILFVSIAIYMWSRYEATGKGKDAILTYACLALLPLCGMNGAIFSTVITGGLLAHCGTRRFLGGHLDKFNLSLLTIPVAVNVMVWTSWMPSEASKRQASFPESLGAVFKLLPASMFDFAANGIKWKSLIIMGLVIAALVTTLRQAIYHRLTMSDLMLSLVLIASLMVIFAVTIGRGPSEHLTFHYGNLTLLLPLAAWIILSKHLPEIASITLALSILILYGNAYYANLEWRSGLILFRQNQCAGVTYALKHETDPGKIVDGFRDEFIWSEDLAADQKRWIVDSINTLRGKGYPNYVDK